MLAEFRRILPFLPSLRRRIRLGFLCLLPATALDLAIPLLWRHGLDAAIAGTLRAGDLATLAALQLLCGGLSAAVKYGLRSQLVGASRELERDLRRALHRKLMDQAPAWFGRTTAGDLMSRLTQDVEAVRMAVGPGAMYVANALLLVVVAFATMASIDWVLTLWMFGPLVLLGLVALAMAPQLARASDAVQQGIGRISAAAAESFSGVRVLKLFAREGRQLERMREFGLGYVADQMRLARARAGLMALLFFVKDLSLFVILLVGGLHVIEGSATVGDFVLFREWLIQCFWPLVTFGWIVSMAQRGAAGMRRLADVLDAPDELPRPATGRVAAGDGLSIEWRNVSLDLGGRRVLHDLSLAVPAGTTLGITGPTGAGKSLLVELIPRLRDPTAGEVLIGGVNTRAWDRDELRRRIGVVPQDAFLFSDSLRDNLRFAAPDAADTQVLAAAAQAGLEPDLGTFAHGLDTRVGERGVMLSGGQRQRVTLARVLVAAPPVLLLDDSLSAVNAETEARILAALEDAVRRRTAVIVSHRVAALRRLDRIAVLAEGRVVELGSHAELIARGGIYAKLEREQRLLAEIEAL